MPRKNFCVITFRVMRYLISYDISDDKVRDKIVKYLEAFAFRLQYSVFTCNISTKESKKIWRELNDIASQSEVGNVLMASLCKSCEKNLLLSGNPLEEEKGFFVV